MRKKAILSVKIPGLSKTVEEKPCPAACAELAVDYPKEGEKVHRGHYAIRISNGSTAPQISINDGKWQDCRLDGGFHWYDWFPEKSGPQRISVRTRLGIKWVKTDRKCDVI